MVPLRTKVIDLMKRTRNKNAIRMLSKHQRHVFVHYVIGFVVCLPLYSKLAQHI